MGKFTYFDVVVMNGSFYLFGSGLYWYGVAAFLIGGVASGFVNHITKPS